MKKKPTYKELEQTVKELQQQILDHQYEEKELKTATTRDILEKAPFGIYVVNEKGNIDYVNPAMVQIAGGYYEEFKNINVFTLPTYRIIGMSQKIMDGLDGEYFKMESVKYTSFYGRKTTIRNFIGIPLKEEGKQKLLMIVEDITAAKQAEDDLDKHRRHLQDLVEELVKEHTAILTETNEQLRDEITDHKKAEQKIKFSSEKLRDLFSHLQSVRKENKSNITKEIHDELEQLITTIQSELSN